MPVTTYPGTVTPLRGLTAFTESERDVFFGRDRERDELARLVTSDGFRAGLLFGETGTGKTSLVHAGLSPFLRDHGVVALFCADNSRPIDSFSHTLVQVTGESPRERESAINYLVRIVGEAMAGQMYLFIIDEIAPHLLDDAGQVTGELGELYTRVVTRSAGRARFLFTCASSRVHAFGALERRTGSLFPPSSRYELQRMQPAEAKIVLERTIALAGIDCEPNLAAGVIQTLGSSGPILPADLQIAALAVGELRLRTQEDFARLGSAAELERQWIIKAAAASGNERSALRLLGELASAEVGHAYSSDWLAARASVDPGFARSALTILQDKAVTRQRPIAGSEELHFALAHEILAPRLREIAAPARLSARRAFELLGSKAAQNKRLSVREWWELKRDGIEPSTPAEQAVLARTTRLAKIILAVTAAIPILLLIIIYVTLSGRYYLDIASGSHGVETVVVRAGRPGLTSFNWLPQSPSLGSVVADTGLSRPMVGADSWEKIADGDVTGDLEGDEYVRSALAAADTRVAGLITYAADGGESALSELQRSAKSADQLARLLDDLRPIARGGAAEISLVEQALADASPTVLASALSLVVDAAGRGIEPYQRLLAHALASENSELRRQALSSVRTLAADSANEIYRAALATEPEDAVRLEIVAVMSTTGTGSGTSANAAATALLGGDASDSARQAARRTLERAFISDAPAAITAAAKLVASDTTSPGDRIFAAELLLDFATAEQLAELTDAARAAAGSKDPGVHAIGVRLQARIDPDGMAGELAVMGERGDLSAADRRALAMGWGEVARSGNKVAEPALAVLIKDSDTDVRAAAAHAYGYTGRSSQPELAKMIKSDYYDVAAMAAYGMANAAEVGGSTPTAIGGIREMWKRKGRSRRLAAEVYARMARHKPSSVHYLLASSARSTEDTRLHPVGVQGLCNALVAGYTKAGRDLLRSVDDPALEVRRIIIECIVDHPKPAGMALSIASAMADDGDNGIRSEAARVLAELSGDKDIAASSGPVLAKLAQDSDRQVRIIALRGLAGLAGAAPKKAVQALPEAFKGGDEAERLAVLKAARALGVSELAQLAATDASASIRIAAIDTAIATGGDVAGIINSALTDPDPSVRRVALERIAAGEHGMASGDVDQALGLAVRDSDPAIGDLALTTMALLGEPEAVRARLGTLLASRSEHERARAARACRGVAANAPKSAIELLTPVLSDPSHDVRVAMVRAMAGAYAAAHGSDELGEMLEKSEKHATHRLIIAAALTRQIERDGSESARSALSSVAENGPPLAARWAAVALGIVDSGGDASAFFERMVP